MARLRRQSSSTLRRVTTSLVEAWVVGEEFKCQRATTDLSRLLPLALLDHYALMIFMCKDKRHARNDTVQKWIFHMTTNALGSNSYENSLT